MNVLEGCRGDPMGKSCVQRTEGAAWHPQLPPALLLVQKGAAAGPTPGKPTPCIAACLLLSVAALPADCSLCPEEQHSFVILSVEF